MGVFVAFWERSRAAILRAFGAFWCWPSLPFFYCKADNCGPWFELRDPVRHSLLHYELDVLAGPRLAGHLLRALHCCDAGAQAGRFLLRQVGKWLKWGCRFLFVFDNKLVLGWKIMEKIGLTLIGINVLCEVPFYFVCICQKCCIISA